MIDRQQYNTATTQSTHVKVLLPVQLYQRHSLLICNINHVCMKAGASVPFKLSIYNLCLLIIRVAGTSARLACSYLRLSRDLKMLLIDLRSSSRNMFVQP